VSGLPLLIYFLEFVMWMQAMKARKHVDALSRGQWATNTFELVETDEIAKLAHRRHERSHGLAAFETRRMAFHVLNVSGMIRVTKFKYSKLS